MMHRMVVSGVLALTLSMAHAADPAWRTRTAGRWTFYTDLNEKNGERVARQVLEAENVLAQMTIALPSSAPPVRVFLFRSKGDFRPFQEGSATAGLYHPGRDCDYIMLLDSGDETLRAARHELAHLVLTRSSLPLPLWMEEGLAEYYSTMQRKGDKAVLGRSIPNHVAQLASGTWMPANQLMTWKKENAPDGEAGPVYAQSWALVHLLMREPDARQRFERFGQLMASGVAQAAAFEQAFGRSLEQLTGAARQDVDTKSFPAREASIAALAQPAAASWAALSDAEARLLRVDALLAYGRDREATQLAQETARRYPDHPAAASALGRLAMARTDYPEARRQLERAVALGDHQGSTYFDLAMLTRDTNGSEETVAELLRKSVEASPSFADAWYLLGTTLLRQKRATESVAALRHATELSPRKSMYWETLGRACDAAGQSDQAKAAAQRAIDTAGTPEQSAMAQGLVRELEQRPKGKPGARPAVVVPKTWEPREGTATVEGKLVRVDCATPSLKFHIQTAPATARTRAKVTVLFSEKPNQIMLRGNSTEKREFVCGYQRNAPHVVAGYVAAPPAPPQKPKAGRRPAPVPPAGELVTLDFK